MIVGETTVFRTEKDSDPLLIGMIQDPGSKRAGRVGLGSIPAGFARSPHQETDAPQGDAERTAGFCGIENRPAAFGKAIGFFVNGALRCREDETAQSHIEHGPCGGTYIPGILGPQKDYGDIASEHSVTLKQRHFRGHLFVADQIHMPEYL